MAQRRRGVERGGRYERIKQEGEERERKRGGREGSVLKGRANAEKREIRKATRKLTPQHCCSGSSPQHNITEGERER